jgi:UDP-glucuronate decarboxylase
MAVAAGNEVICLDNFYTGSKRNIMHLMADPMFTVLEHDVTNPLFVQVDEIYNLACPASPVHYQYDPVHTTKTSVLGAINMLGLAKRVNARIMHASTSEVYGDPEVHPQVESYWGHVNPTGYRACYDEALCGNPCFDYIRRHRISARWWFNTMVRVCIPTTVGSNDVQALKRPITIYGNGSDTVLLLSMTSLTHLYG